MPKRALRILPYRGSRDYECYIDGLKANGKRKRLFFKTEKEAIEELKRLSKQIHKEGEDGANLSPSSRILAAKAEEMLRPYGKSLWDAASFYVDHLERVLGQSAGRSLGDVFADYSKAKERERVSQKYRNDIRLRLGRFVTEFGKDKPIKPIPVSEIEQWLECIDLAPLTINNLRALISSLFQFALVRGWIEKNPVTPIAKIKKDNQGAPASVTVSIELLVAIREDPLRAGLGYCFFSRRLKLHNGLSIVLAWSGSLVTWAASAGDSLGIQLAGEKASSGMTGQRKQTEKCAS